jgi:hypothetical protein
MQYTAIGGISIFGCARIKHSAYYVYKYGENSIVFLRNKAAKGNLEKIAIKKVILQSSHKTGGQIVPLYQDTLNSYYNEEELCTHKEAVDLAIAYYETLKALTLEASKKCFIHQTKKI